MASLFHAAGIVNTMWRQDPQHSGKVSLLRLKAWQVPAQAQAFGNVLQRGVVVEQGTSLSVLAVAADCPLHLECCCKEEASLSAMLVKVGKQTQFLPCLSQSMHASRSLLDFLYRVRHTWLRHHVCGARIQITIPQVWPAECLLHGGDQHFMLCFSRQS